MVRTSNIAETLWATEQALLADCCMAVFSWTGKHDLSLRQLRRLQLATQKTQAWNVIFRHSDCLQQASPSGLRMQLQSNAYSQLETHIVKQPYGWAGQRCTLSMSPHYENWQRLPAHLLPHKNLLHNNLLHKNQSNRDSSRSKKSQSLLKQTDRACKLKHRKRTQLTASVTLLSSVAALQSVC